MLGPNSDLQGAHSPAMWHTVMTFMLMCTKAGPDCVEGALLVAPDPKEEWLVAVFQILVCPRYLLPTSGRGGSHLLHRRNKASPAPPHSDIASPNYNWRERQRGLCDKCPDCDQ